MSDSDRPSPAPSSQDERSKAFALDVMAALLKADAKIDGLERQVSALNARQGSHTVLLAVIALLAQLVGPGLRHRSDTPPAAPSASCGVQGAATAQSR